MIWRAAVASRHSSWRSAGVYVTGAPFGWGGVAPATSCRAARALLVGPRFARSQVDVDEDRRVVRGALALAGEAVDEGEARLVRQLRGHEHEVDAHAPVLVE